MNEVTKDLLMDLIEKIDAVSAAMASVEDGYGEKLNAMYVEHDEIGKLQIDLGKISSDLGNLREYVEQHIKEEEAYYAK